MIYIQLDTHLKTSEERLEYINNLLQSKTSFTENELEWMATYLTYPLEKEERRQRRIMTDNRRVTIEAHESSYEGLSTKFEAGDDALEAISQSRPVLPTRITPRKRPITTRDLDTIPGLRSVRESAAQWQQRSKTTTGRVSYIAARAYREDSALQYILRDSYAPPIGAITTPNYTAREPDYYSKEWIEPNGEIQQKGYSLLSSDLCGVLLKQQIKLKGKNWGKFNDLWFLIMDFEKFMRQALEPFPVYQLIVEAKWSNLSNVEIQEEIYNEFGKHYTPEFISNCFCNKIPKLISETYYDHFLDYWYLNVEKGTYKTCSHCGRVLLAHPRFFNRNSTSRDGFQSQCKQCRSDKRRKK